MVPTDDILERNNCKRTFAYLDNITIRGKTEEERDANLHQFLKAAAKHNLTFNKNKRTYSSDCISLLGYQIHVSTMRPDPERAKSLLDMPVLKSKKSGAGQSASSHIMQNGCLASLVK